VTAGQGSAGSCGLWPEGELGRSHSAAAASAVTAAVSAVARTRGGSRRQRSLGRGESEPMTSGGGASRWGPGA